MFRAPINFLTLRSTRFCLPAWRHYLHVSYKSRSVVQSQLCIAKHLKLPVLSTVSNQRAYSTDENDPVSLVGDLVKGHRVVVFMKGDPDEPRCGFSNAVCRILEMYGILDSARASKDSNVFASYDVLENDELRSAAKIYADWPTFPQVYFDGEFVGGCDILLEMHRSGKLQDELNRRNISSSLKHTNEQPSE